MDSFKRISKDQVKIDNTSPMMANSKYLLEKLISSCNGKYNPIRSFSQEEPKTATDNFDAGKVITRAASYELYKGILEDYSVSVMKFRDDPSRSDAYEYCFNNIVFASQMKHKNLFKLIGCCLETEILLLVFESVEYGTLSDHIYGPRQPHFVPLLLTPRLKIAMEMANALAYLHVGFCRPIVFRSINPTNILFQEQTIVKLSDFSLSEYIPEGETYIKDTRVVGTMGFFAPEYISVGVCNEKCNVFAFGVLLLVLLTGQKTFDSSRCENGDDSWLLQHVKNCIGQNDRFIEIIDPVIVLDGLNPGKEDLL
ncbi:hypothetical protein Pint_19811 [Pistacia integerrima]|uniref:Uncharacterized protein n=1 Tax=Pistacia integerrima TaxID=434235 RepID=A0ACC0X973_9ROSI|nr:hypothetical protein Pint_19811 [Pistacia integerrima]